MGFFDKMCDISTMEGATLSSINIIKGRIHNFSIYDYWCGMGSITYEDEECKNGMKDFAYETYSLMNETDWRSGSLATRYMFNLDCKW